MAFVHFSPGFLNSRATLTIFFSLLIPAREPTLRVAFLFFGFFIVFLVAIDILLSIQSILFMSATGEIKDLGIYCGNKIIINLLPHQPSQKSFQKVLPEQVLKCVDFFDNLFFERLPGAY